MVSTIIALALTGEETALSEQLEDFGLAPLFCLMANQNPFNKERHLYSRQNFKDNRTAALTEWRQLCAN